MQTQIDSIVKKFRYLAIKLDELDGLTKTLKNSFEGSFLASEDCCYLQSIIHIIRERTNKTKDFADSIHNKLIRLQLHSNKFPLHK